MSDYVLKMKKAQIQSGESITIVIIIAIMLFVGLLYLSAFRTDATETSIQREEELDAMSIAVTASELYEIGCPRATSRITDKCIDLKKLEAFSTEWEENQAHYHSLFGNTNISLRTIHPEEEEYEFYNFIEEVEPEDSITTHIIPVKAYDPINDTMSFSLLQIEVVS